MAHNPDTFPFMVSSTGMVHAQGCGLIFGIGSRGGRAQSLVRYVDAKTAAKMTKRCKHCHPTPLGTDVPQTDRKAARAAEQAQAAAEHRAALEAAAACWAAMQSPELDELLRAFCAAETAAGDARQGEAFEGARDAYRAMQAAAPDGWSSVRRQRELGIGRSVR